MPSSISSEPKPHYRDEWRMRLAEELNDAYERRETLIIAGGDLADITNEILNLRRQQREHLLQPGDLLADGRFRLIDKIGSGGFATVWKAWDKKHGQLVAVKVLHSEYAGEGPQRERFFRGAREMAKLQHHGVVKVIEEKVEDGRFYFFVMELVNGNNLRDAVLTGWIPPSERVRLVLEAGDALAFAQGGDIMHRDVKPTNILIDEAMKAKLTDFDLVWARDTTGGTRTGMLGTVVYAAPEMMSAANQPTEQADVYGLGMTAVFALYGRELPFEILRNAGEFVAELGVDKVVQEILLRAIAWNPDQRYSSVEEFCDALRAYLTESERERLFGWIETPHSGYVELWQRIPAGSFLMGSRMSSDEALPRHRVNVNEPFYIMSVPVTNAQYAAFNPGHRPHAWAGVSNEEIPFYPAVDVSWYEAVDFCRWLARTFSWARGARLPTEEEWEYACRATTETRYWSGDQVRDLDRIGWLNKNSSRRAHRVGEKQPNAWGLYDVHGNVWEWTLGAWTTYSDRIGGVFAVFPHRVDAESLNAASNLRVIRGGSFRQPADRARSACRNFRRPGEADSDRGFRVVLPHDAPLPACLPPRRGGGSGDRIESDGAACTR